MKDKIHPKYFPQAKVTCACGNTFTIGSTQEKIKIEICSGCHPLYTGEEKIIDTAGRVEKFKVRRAKAVKKQINSPRLTRGEAGVKTKQEKKKEAHK